MTPKEAGDIMRNKALLLLEKRQELYDTGIVTFSADELLEWCCAIMDLYAEFIWNTADMLEKIGEAAHIELYHIPGEDAAREADRVDRAEGMSPIDPRLLDPPFEKDFFNRDWS